MTKSIFFTLAVVIGINLHAQDFYDLNTIQTIEITFAQSNWDQLLDAAYSSTGDYIMAQSISINGEMFDSVGVKYKGNSTYQANQAKNPFHIELDTYKEQDYEGYSDIKLSNVAKDPSFLREVLSYQILRQYMDAPLSNYANVYVNGTLIGLYSNSEAISKKFVKDRFGSKNNTLVKCNPPDGAGPGTTNLPDLTYKGQDSTSYYSAYEMKSDYGWKELINLCDTLVNNVSDIEKVLDVDRALWMLAFDNVLVNLDSYIGGFAQNYYLYRDDNQRFVPVVWDLNESFGVFAQTGSGMLNSTSQKQQMSHLLNLNDADYPLVQKLLAIPMYKRMYLAHYKTILLENFDNNSYYTTGQSLQTLISAAVQADVNKFFTYNNFISNLTSDVTSGGGPGASSSPGITNLMNGRNSYLLALSDFTQTEPSITNITLSDTAPLINSTIVISASITNENAVYLGFRTEKNLPFERVEMYDDGAHNDGAANDGTYAVELNITDIFLQYYIYAENATAGMFSPKRAEYEYHTITATYATQSGDVVINEFMASNSATAADQDGEFDDWIELFNNGSSSIDLSGYSLSDDSSDLMQWTFPTGTTIAANGYLIIWADNDENQAGLHANFKLSASGETILLVNPAGVIVDQVSYLTQTTDVAYARIPNGIGSFQTNGPTFDANNESVNEIPTVVSDKPVIKVSPNPATGSFTIEIKSLSTPSEVLIYDLRGVLQFRETIYQQQTIDCSQWAKGMYVVRVGNSFVKLVVS